ncbi:helix-turn-helix domain-containing protein [Negadavirga shengliensis]|uniref:Helix-turn-helix domain-containing protein n=1 Tax=Negadavirga shengliensis TaxID=1389218 RepID=A0ABV9T6Q6_9BACT
MEKPAHSQAFRSLLEVLEREVEANLKNEQFGVEELAQKVGMSRSNLHRKLQSATGQSVSQYIREYRLRKALEHLEIGDLTVAEVAYEVGFGSPSYFTTCFTEYFGYAPSMVKHKIKAINTDHKENSAPNTPQHHPFRAGKLIVSGLFLAVLLTAIFVYQFFIKENEKGPIALENSIHGKSIAVLPFRNLSTDDENEYFVDGVVGTITTHLSRIKDLKVISRTSADRYRESAHSIPEIARELRVSHLLEGSIQRFQNTVRIDVRLVDAGSEGQVWAEHYDRELKDIFMIQNEIAENVSSVLQTTLSPEEKVLLSQASTDNPEAYDLYLKGEYEFNTYTRSGIHRAARCFQQAIALDSGYALAYGALAATYILKAGMFGAELSPLEAFSLAKPLLDKALALDPGNVETITWKGFYLLYNDWDFEGAEQLYQKAIASDFQSALAVYADFLNFIGRHDEALAVSRRLDQTDPYYPNTRMILSLYYTGRYEEAEEFALARMRMFNNHSTMENYGFLLLNTGRHREAISLFQRVLQIEGIRYPRVLGWMGAAYARAGETGKALELMAELKEKINENDAGALRFFIAVICAALDDKPSALQWLQEAYAQHEMEIPWLKSEPQFYGLHEDPAFQDLLARVGFP